jgi:hypothetical protein
LTPARRRVSMVPMRRAFRTLAAVLAGLALVAALPAPCGCAPERSVPAPGHACCAPPTGVSAAARGCCDESPEPTPAIASSATVAGPVPLAVAVAGLASPPALRALAPPPVAPASSPPPTVLRI